MDSTMWVAVLTGGTAVLAGWVTSLGNTRAAKIQAQASTQALQVSQQREARRVAYLDLIEQAHAVGELYWRFGAIEAQTSDPDEQATRLDALRTHLRNAFDPLKRCVRVVLLEGPASVSQEAERLLEATSGANSSLYLMTQNEQGARERFTEATHIYRCRMETLINAARTAMNEL